MVHSALPRVSNMKADEIFEEMRTRLYELGDARSHVLPNAASEPHQLSLYPGLRIADMIAELLRYKFYDGEELSLRRDDWKARRDDLLEALRMPWGQCASNSGSPNCPGGSIGCEICRYSILSIACQLNTLALGFAGTAFLQKDEGRGLQDQEKDRDAAGGRGKDKAELDSIKQELASARTKLSDAEKTIEGLQKDHASTKDMLETTQKLAKKNADDHKKDQIFWGKLKKAYSSMTENVKECAESLDSLESFKDSSSTKVVWHVASKQCEALNEMVSFQLSEGLAMEKLAEEDLAKRRGTLEQEALGYQHQQVQALMKIGQHKKAEKRAKEVLDQMRRHLGKDAKKTRAIFKDYCEILEKVGKVQAAEFEYMQIWYDQSLESDGFQDEAGVSLAQLKQRQNETEEETLWYRKVAELRLARLDLDPAAEVALKMVSSQKSFHLSPSSAKVLKDIWDKGQQQNNPEVQLNTAILDCSQLLGGFYVSIGEYGEAKAVLVAVWKELGKDGDKYLDKQMRVALSLAAIVPELVDGDDSDLQDLYKWISDHANSKADKKLSLKFQYQLGCLQLSRQDREKAEKTLEAAWQQAKGAEGPGSSDELTVDIGCEYAQAILAKPGREKGAKAVFEELWTALEGVRNLKMRAKVPRTARQIGSVLTTARPYAELLLEAAEACKSAAEQKLAYETAKKVLESAWNVAWSQRDKLVADRNLGVLTDLLWTGDSYGDCLTYLGSPGKAVEELTRVLEMRHTWNPNAAEIDFTSGLLREARDAQQRLKKAADDGPQGGKPPAGAGVNKYSLPAPQPKPKPPKPRKQPRRIRLLKFFAGVQD